MKRTVLRLLPVVALSLCALAARADVIFAVGTVAQPNEQLIDFNVGDTGNTIDGWSDGSMLPVIVSSKDDALKVYSHGSNFGLQTDHGPNNTDTSVNDVTISVNGGTFGDLLGSVYGVFAQHPEVDFTVWTTDSSTPWTWSFTGNLDNRGNEDNFWSIYTINGEQISKVLITGKFYELRDLNISGPTIPQVPPTQGTPEPASLVLLGSGVLGLLTLRRKK